MKGQVFKRSLIKTQHFEQRHGMTVSLFNIYQTPHIMDLVTCSRYVKGLGTLFFNGSCTEGIPFLPKVVYQRVVPLGGAFPYKTSLNTHQALNTHQCISTAVFFNLFKTLSIGPAPMIESANSFSSDQRFALTWLSQPR